MSSHTMTNIAAVSTQSNSSSSYVSPIIHHQQHMSGTPIIGQAPTYWTQATSYPPLYQQHAQYYPSAVVGQQYPYPPINHHGMALQMNIPPPPPQQQPPTHPNKEDDEGDTVYYEY
jgi:hypothetical protein